MDNTTTVTIDLAKDVFQIAVFNKYGKALINKAISPMKVREFISGHPEALIYMEACARPTTGGVNSNSWGTRSN
jgi:transposase